jgi:hypothetical protein
MTFHRRSKVLRAAVLSTLAVLGCVATAVPVAADMWHTTYLTFSQDVALPNVVLPRGSYTFEIVSPTGNIVRVSSRANSRIYFSGFTRQVDRPLDLPRDRVVAFGETRPGAPTPVKAWYPRGRAFGYEFIR